MTSKEAAAIWPHLPTEASAPKEPAASSRMGQAMYPAVKAEPVKQWFDVWRPWEPPPPREYVHQGDLSKLVRRKK
jgi:hypothetical protein